MEPGNTLQSTPIQPILQGPRANEIIQLSSDHESLADESDHESDLQIMEKDPNYHHPKQDQGKNLNQEKVQLKDKKARKVSPKCYICKKVGLRLESRQCTQCNQSYHLNCLTNRQGRSTNKFLCENCQPLSNSGTLRNQNSKKVAIENKRADKQRSKEVQLTLKFSHKPYCDLAAQKNKELNTKVLQNFKERYPYYIDQFARVRFPVDDKLLLIYRELFEPEKQLPSPQQPANIPSIHLGDMLIIENFCMSFKNEREFGFYPTKQVIYSSFKQHPADLCFKSLLEYLLIIYLGDIFDRNKTENVRALNQNTFFELLHFLKQNLEMQMFLPAIWKQVVQKLEKIPSMSKAFDRLDKNTDIQSLEGKIHVIKELIMGLSEVDTFHDILYRKTQKKQDMTKERGQLVIELKKDEAQILTLAQTMKDNETKLKDLQQQIQTSQKKDESNKLLREQEKLKKANSKIEAQINKSKENVARIKTRISEINKSIPFITGEIQLLGRDRNQSQYYLYSRQPNKIYVNYKPTLLSTEARFKVLTGKDRISNYLKYFSSKGTKEKLLHGVIINHLKCGVISDNQYVDDEQRPEQPKTYEKSAIQLRAKDVAGVILECDTSFTNYLSKKNCRWVNPAKRESFRSAILKNINDMTVLRDSLKFIHEHFLYVENLGGGDEESDDAKSEKMELQGEQESFKRKRIRLWGIYFEKIKKYWVEYLETADTLESVWISSIIFQHFVQRYIRKKIEGAEEKQRKLQKEMQKQREREKKQRHERVERNRQERYNLRESSGESQQESKHRPSKPTTRGRLVRKSERNVRHVNLKQLSSSSEDKYQQSQESEQESHEDACEVCGQFGQMLCCDTCPKVFHISCLKLKQVPDDEWSCVKCLQRLANERQTRSRTRKLYLQ